MSLSDLASLGSFLSGIAVLASLVFVFFQLRQNDKTQRALMHQSALQRTIDTNMFVFGAVNAPLLDKVPRGERIVAPAEALQLGGIVRISVLNLEDVLWQQNAGFLDEATVRGVITSMQRWFALPGARIAWALFRGGYSEEQVKLVEELIVTSAPSDGTDFGAAWKAAAERVLGAPKT
jgi:hypothetical protein